MIEIQGFELELIVVCRISAFFFLNIEILSDIKFIKFIPEILLFKNIEWPIFAEIELKRHELSWLKQW